MPIIKSAIKKMRKDRFRSARNKKRQELLKSLIKKVRREPSGPNLTAVYSALDKAAKVGLIHPNKSARLKSRLSKLVSQPAIASHSKAAISKKTSKKKIVKKKKR